MTVAVVTLLAIPCPYHNFKIFDTNSFFKNTLGIREKNYSNC